MTTKISVILMALAITAIHSLPQGYQQYYSNPPPNYNYHAQQYYSNPPPNYNYYAQQYSNGYNQMQGNFYPQGNPAPVSYYNPYYGYQQQTLPGYQQQPQRGNQQQPRRGNQQTTSQVPTGPVWPGAGWGEAHYTVANKLNTTDHTKYDVAGNVLGLEFSDIGFERTVKHEGGSTTIVHETTWEGPRAY